MMPFGDFSVGSLLVSTHNPPKTTPLGERLTLAPLTTEEWVAQFVSDYGRSLLVGLALLLGVLLLGYSGYVWLRGHSEKDYFAVSSALEQLQNAKEFRGSSKAEKAYQTLVLQLERHPELEPRYAGAVAQALLRLGAIQEALPFANRAIALLQRANLPFYQEYAKISLLGGEKQFRDAYQRAAYLQRRIEEEPQESQMDFGPVLEQLNQVRIASLLQQLGAKGDETKAWQDLRLLKGTDLLYSLRADGITFSQYIDERIKSGV